MSREETIRGWEATAKNMVARGRAKCEECLWDTRSRRMFGGASESCESDVGRGLGEDNESTCDDGRDSDYERRCKGCTRRRGRSRSGRARLLILTLRCAVRRRLSRSSGRSHRDDRGLREYGEREAAGAQERARKGSIDPFVAEEDNQEQDSTHAAFPAVLLASVPFELESLEESEPEEPFGVYAEADARGAVVI